MKNLVRRVVLCVAVMLLMCPAAWADVAINATNFPDAVFRQYVSEHFDSNKDGKLSTSEIASAKNIEIYDTNLATLKGIEYLTSLTELNCPSNQLTTLDVSKNSALSRLECYGNKLSNLDVSHNSALTFLNCGENLFTTLDVSKNSNLTFLGCGNNQLSALNLSNNPKLETLYCRNNKFTTLDVSKNPNLTFIECYGNQLTTLNVSNNPKLEYLDCTWNQLTTLDVSRCSKLQYFDCGGNKLTSLNVTGCTELEFISFAVNQLRTVDVSRCTKLEVLICWGGKVTSLNLNSNTALLELHCDQNEITALDLSKNKSLEVLNCSYNKLSALNVRNNTELVRLDCRSNNLSALDVSKCINLDELDFGINNITAIDVSKCTNLSYLSCRVNRLTALNVMNNSNLGFLNCSNNKLSTLDLSNNPDLWWLDCSNNNLTSLKTSGIDGEGFMLNGNDALFGYNFTNNNVLNIGCDYYITDTGSAYEFNFTDFLDTYKLDNFTANEAGNYTFIAYSFNDIDGDGIYSGGEFDGDEHEDDTLEVISATDNLYNLATISTSSGKTIVSFPHTKSQKLFRIEFIKQGYNYDKDFPIEWTVQVYPVSAKSQNTAPSITTASLTAGNTGAPYGLQLQATGTSPITWTLSGDVPGLSLSTSGYLSGTPTTAGTFTLTVQAVNSAGSDTKTLTLTISETPSGTKPSIATATLTSGVTGKDYTFQLMASGSTPITWTLKGQLPDGLEMDEDGFISGIPTKKGTKKITLTATNDFGTDTKKLSLVVNEPPQITTEELKEGTVGKKYTLALKAKGTKPLTWTLEGDLPDGVEFDAVKGKFSGTPTVNGTYTVLVMLENEGGSVVETYDLTINAILPVISPKSLKKGTWGKKYDATIKTSKGTQPITLTLEGDLPEGLTFDSETGKITGTPAEACDERELTAIATNMAGEVEKEYTLTIKGVAPKITTKKLPDAKINEPYSVDIEATGTPEITWDAEGLPDGLSITDEGVIEGTPAKEGKHKFTVTAKNSAKTAKKNYTLNVFAAPEFVDEDGTLPGGTEGSAYSYTPTVTGSKKITFSITSGSLPNGIKLNASKGTLKGKPKASGTFNFTITASNSVGTESMEFTLEIEAKAGNTKYAREEYAVIENNNSVGDNENYSGSYIIAAELPEVSVDVSGMHDFSVTLGENAPVGAKLLWLARSDAPSDDDKIAEFYDELGEEVGVVPESKKLTVSAWFNKDVIYKPAVAVIAQ